MRSADERMDWDAAAGRELRGAESAPRPKPVFTTVVPVEGAEPVKAPASWRATGDIIDRGIAAGQLRVVCGR